MNSQRPLVKICGVTDPSTAYRIAKSGVDYIGIVLHSSSKRNVNITQASEIADFTQVGGAKLVAVFVDQTADQMSSICDETNIKIVQLHGDTARSSHSCLADDITRIYVLHVDEQGDIVNGDDEGLKELNPKRDFLLFDGLHGGSGQRIKTHNLDKYSGDYRYFIAGGLDSDNVADVVESLEPYAVDVSSAVEDELGNKDLKKIDEFLEQLALR